MEKRATHFANAHYVERTNLTPSQLDTCSCTRTPKPRKSGRRRATGIAIALAFVALVIWGGSWAIEHAPTEIDRCNGTLSSELLRVFGDVCSNRGAPLAIVH